jgi:hypothetical protein
MSYIAYILTTGEYIGAGKYQKGQRASIDEISPATKKFRIDKMYRI